MHHRSRLLIALLALAGFVLAPIAALATTPPVTAEVVNLRKDCTGVSNCFQDDLDGLNTWIWNTRQPSAASPLIVDIGPGDFNGQIDCPAGAGNGYVTFRGMGRERSRIMGDPTEGTPIKPSDCQELNFQDLAAVAQQGFLQYAVYDRGAATTTWTNVDLIGGDLAWYDFHCGGSPTDKPAGLHTFYNVRFRAEAGGFYGECGESWLYGCDILVTPEPDGTIASGGDFGVSVAYRAAVHLYGSTVRITTKDLASAISPAPVGLMVGPSGNPQTAPNGYGTLHAHSGIVNVDGSKTPGQSVTALEVDSYGTSGINSAFAHTPNDAFRLLPGPGGNGIPAGTAIRTTGDGTIKSPFLWPSGTAPPVTNLSSLTGKDMYVETDCKSTGCGTGGADPHLMIYDSNCTNSPWFDVVRGACKN